MSCTCVVSQCERCHAIRGLCPVERPRVETDGQYHLLQFLISERLCDRVVGGLHAVLEGIRENWPHLSFHRVWRHDTLNAYGCVASDPSFPPVLDPTNAIPWGHCVFHMRELEEGGTVTEFGFVVFEQDHATKDLRAEEIRSNRASPGLRGPRGS